MGAPHLRRRVRVAVWGLGAHARNKILPAISASSTTTLVGVTSRNGATVEQDAARFACHPWLTPEAMLCSDEVDVVYIATPPALHHAQGKAALLAGKHVWCEKPLATRAADVAELVDLSRSQRRSLCEGFMYLYHPQFLRLREIAVEKATLGRICSVTARFGMPFLDRPSFRSSKALGGGALFDLACYPVSLVTQLVSALPTVRLTTIRQGLDVDSEGHALIDFPSGTVAYLEWGFGRAYVNEVRIWGDRGALYANHVFSKASDHTSTLYVDDVRGTRTMQSFEPANAHVRMFEAFTLAVDDDDLQERFRQDIQRQAQTLEALSIR